SPRALASTVANELSERRDLLRVGDQRSGMAVFSRTLPEPGQSRQVKSILSRSDDPIIVRRRKRRALRDWFTGAAPEPPVIFAFIVTRWPTNAEFSESHREHRVGDAPPFGLCVPISKAHGAAAIVERTGIVDESVERMVRV